MKRTVTLRDDFKVTYFERECPLGCMDEKNRPTTFGASTEEQLRKFVSAHRNCSQCVERAHRNSQRVQSDISKRSREERAVKAEVVAALPPPPDPKKKVPKPTWRNSKITRTTGWDGKPLV